MAVPKAQQAVMYAAAASFTVVFPAGSLAGDTALLQCCGAYNITAPTGWTALFAQNGSSWNTFLGWKILTAGDITAGSVTISLANSYIGSSNIVIFSGTVPFREVETVITSGQMTTSSAVLATDLGIGFGSAREESVTPTFTPGTVLASQVSGTSATTIYSIPLTAGVNTIATNMLGPTGSSQYQSAIVVAEIPQTGGGGGGVHHSMQCAVCGFSWNYNDTDVAVANLIAAQHTAGWGPAHVVTLT